MAGGGRREEGGDEKCQSNMKAIGAHVNMVICCYIFTLRCRSAASTYWLSTCLSPFALSF
eukprot:m.34212 g.34212  ORF g.34212 m.34212 type:complete len:60 (-) comp10985_c0_seq1:93-272(-)